MNYLNIMHLILEICSIYSYKNNYELYFLFNFSLLIDEFNKFVCQIVSVIE